MKAIIIGGIVVIVLAGGGYWIYEYLNPEDVVVNEELDIDVEEEDLPSGVLGMPDSSFEEDGFSTSQPIDGEGSQEIQSQTESSFQQGDSSYSIDGDLVVTRTGDDRSLSFIDFSVTAGPDLLVYLVRTNDTSNEGVKMAVEAGNFVSIAELKGNIGNQGYQVPADVDLDDYNVVSIWCKQFTRNFGHAVIE